MYYSSGLIILNKIKFKLKKNKKEIKYDFKQPTRGFLQYSY